VNTMVNAFLEWTSDRVNNISYKYSSSRIIKITLDVFIYSDSSNAIGPCFISPPDNDSAWI